MIGRGARADLTYGLLYTFFIIEHWLSARLSMALCCLSVAGGRVITLLSFLEASIYIPGPAVPALLRVNSGLLDLLRRHFSPFQHVE